MSELDQYVPIDRTKTVLYWQSEARKRRVAFVARLLLEIPEVDRLPMLTHLGTLVQTSDTDAFDVSFVRLLLLLIKYSKPQPPPSSSNVVDIFSMKRKKDGKPWP